MTISRFRVSLIRDVNSLGEISKLMNSQSFDLVFHYAAVVGVKRTLDDPISVLNDIDGIKNILNLSVETNVQQVFFSSSSESTLKILFRFTFRV